MRTTYSSPTAIAPSRPSTLLKLANSVGATRSRSDVISAITRSGDSDDIADPRPVDPVEQRPGARFRRLELLSRPSDGGGASSGREPSTSLR